MKYYKICGLRFLFIVFFLVLFNSCKKLENTLGFSSEEFNRLLYLSDTSNTVSDSAVLYILEEITDIFIRNEDNRGLFPAVYHQTTIKAYQSVINEPEVYADLDKVKELIVAFAKRYLYNLHNHLKGNEVEYHWQQYYKLTQTKQPRVRIAATGVNAHLTVDLPRSLYDVKCYPEFKDDYTRFGGALILATPFIIESLQENFNTDLGYLFNGLFAGPIIDALLGEGFTTELAFNFIREEAFENGTDLLINGKFNLTQQKIKNIFQLRENTLGGLVSGKLLF